MNFLEGLNPQQQQAVRAQSGPVLVLAGPGSGKTRVLTHRIAYLIGSLGVRPYNVLAVTFTNKAAREMERRVNHLIGERTQGLTLGTFHASCARILHRESQHLPIKPNFVIFDADDQIDLVRHVIRELDLDDKRFRPAGIHASISNAKNELLLPENYPVQTYWDEIVQRVYLRYQELLLVSNALDFDDLLLWTAHLLDEVPEVRSKYAQRYEYILVDEFQDTNQAQYILLKHISAMHRNIFIVGDMDQSIYRWRGADYRNVLRFERDFPDTQVILLEQNYRSTQAILDVATAVINRHPHRKPKQLFTTRGQGAKVMLHGVYDDREEAIFVVETIANLIARAQAQPGDFAVMYRTNAQSRLIEEAFLRLNLPYKLVGAQRFYGRREIKDIVAYLRLVHNPADEISLVRAINTPRRGIGDKTLFTLRTLAKESDMPMGAFLLQWATSPSSQSRQAVSARTGAALADFGRMLENWIDRKGSLTPIALMEQILQDIGYHDYIDDGTEEGHDRWENVKELGRLAVEYNQRGLAEFLEQVALVSDQDTLEGNLDVPTLLTLHAAKGLEFPIIMIVGLNEGTLPHSRSLDEPEELMEERRLFYVGITRAMDRLYLICAQNRSAFGYADPVEPSRFLEDIPIELISTSGSASMYLEPAYSSGSKSARWIMGTNIMNQTHSIEQKYHPGMHVLHPKWGEGMVLNSRLDRDDEIVDIFFDELGLKRVAASLVNLQITS